jgi:hypothetical protein
VPCSAISALSIRSWTWVCESVTPAHAAVRLLVAASPATATASELADRFCTLTDP